MIIYRTHLKRGDFLLDRYQIQAFLGSGGMSSVYLAEDLKNHRKPYAIKESRLDPRWTSQLFIEAKTLGELDHPNLPRVAELFLSGDRNYFYMVQDYIDGVTLAKLFQQHQGKISTPELLGFLVETCGILEYLHSENIVYKDLKPSNLMVDKHRHIQLIDFGIAQKYGVSQSNSSLRIGTVGFAAPEQYHGKQTDARTDLYALGALMFYLFSGGKQVGRCRETLQQLRPDLHRKLYRCVETLTKVDPDDRIQTAQEVRKLLEGIVNKKRWRS